MKALSQSEASEGANKRDYETKQVNRMWLS